MKKFYSALFCIFLLAACAPTSQTQPTFTPAPIIPTPINTPTPLPAGLWIDPSVPHDLRLAAESWDILLVDNPDLATLKFEPASNGSTWIYALAAPFPTVQDDVTFADLLAFWKTASSDGMPVSAILMAESTQKAFTVVWGEPAPGAVRSVNPEEMLNLAWEDMSVWAVIPFEEIQPKWKIISVDGQSPIRKNFTPETYQLKVIFGLTDPGAFDMPITNRDPQKMTTVILTGVTALVRATAVTMELKGVAYPGSLIRDWMREADITHISNEVSFDKDCPTPNSSYRNFILCSDPKYIDLLNDVGVDVVELTGDHFRDRGVQAMLDTLDIYKQNNIPYYGGGANSEEAQKPVLMDVNGNKIAFMGCNGKRTLKYPKATATEPGPALCDYDFFDLQILKLKHDGYNVIFTFQHEECYSPGPCFNHLPGFHIIADSGATIVSGSQAHYPHMMEFHDDTFVHFGLGNLFFDQMTYTLPDGQVIDETRREFIDRHVFYDGKYINTELLTAMLEDYARPRPMNAAERGAFLSDYFYYSGWTLPSPTPIPQPTVTLTPIAVP